MSNKLTVLDDVQDFMLTCQKQDEADAIEWAIDQLRLATPIGAPYHCRRMGNDFRWL